jgi:hypothetical protein
MTPPSAVTPTTTMPFVATRRIDHRRHASTTGSRSVYTSSEDDPRRATRTHPGRRESGGTVDVGVRGRRRAAHAHTSCDVGTGAIASRRAERDEPHPRKANPVTARSPRKAGVSPDGRVGRTPPPAERQSPPPFVRASSARAGVPTPSSCRSWRLNAATCSITSPSPGHRSWWRASRSWPLPWWRGWR